MKTDALVTTARDLVPPGKGILAADESHATLARRAQRRVRFSKGSFKPLSATPLNER